jgi:hypothetical protein
MLVGGGVNRRLMSGARKECSMDQLAGRSRWMIGVVAGCLFMSVALAEAQASDERTVSEKIGETAKKVGTKIEEGVKKVVKKVEDKHIGDKVGQKLKKAADKTAEGFTKAGNKVKDKLAD